MSAAAARGRGVSVPLKIDFARHLSHDQCHDQFRQWQQHQGKKLVRKLLSQNAPDITITSTSPDRTWSDVSATDAGPRGQELKLPARLAEKFLELENIPHDQPAATLTAGHMHRLVERIKNATFTVHATRGFKEAMVTAGGIKLAEVDPHTLESKKVPGLFLTGEVLDLTGPSGGYNLQLAFSTGHLAGTVIAARFLASADGNEPRMHTDAHG